MGEAGWRKPGIEWCETSAGGGERETRMGIFQRQTENLGREPGKNVRREEESSNSFISSLPAVPPATILANCSTVPEASDFTG